MRNSALDFIKGVKPLLEDELKVKIFPIEDWQTNELAVRFDQAGIDGFYFTDDGRIHALASRVNYSTRAATKPIFSFRYSLYLSKTKGWDDNREFKKKLNAANSPENFELFPKLHVESFSKEKGSGSLGWSFAAQTRDILNYIENNLDNPEKVFQFEPRVGERRKVICAYVEPFAMEYPIIPVRYK